jgi:hypothetical protein
MCVKTDEKNYRIFKRTNDDKMVFHSPSQMFLLNDIIPINFSIDENQMWYSEGEGEPYMKQ